MEITKIANGRGRKLYIETYGCQMNVGDSEIIVSIMQNEGYIFTKKIEEADIILVMKDGSIIEQGTLEDVFNRTKHPYTEGLFNSLPNINARGTPLIPIPGLMPDPTNLPEGCAFAPRCKYATDACRQAAPTVHRFSDTHKVRCTAYDTEGFHIDRKER